MPGTGLSLGRSLLGCAGLLGLGVLFDQGAGGFEQLGAVIAAFVHVLNPFHFQLARFAAEVLCFFGADGGDDVFVLHSSSAARDVVLLLYLAQPGRGFDAAVVFNDLFQVGRQAVVLGLVHGQHEGGGVERATRRVEFGVVLGKLI